MSPPGCQKMLAKPGNQNAEERCPVHSLKSQAQKPPNPLLIQDKNILQPSQVLHEGVIYRHIILTVPAMFRTTFYQHAAVVLSAFMRCGVQCLDEFYSDVRGKELRGGYITVIH